ncbi:MAG: class I SAM-dependent methyltransferase [Solirubrobacteraceae bacterium]
MPVTSKLYDPDDYRRPAFAEMRRYFESWWYILAQEKVKFSYSHRNRAWEYATVITSVPFADRRVLDLGTSGSLAPIYLARRLGCEVVTFDMAWEAERRSLYGATGVADRVRVDVGNLLDELPYPDSSFDVVTCWSVIEHLRDYCVPISEMKRVCRAGGHIGVTTDFAPQRPHGVKSGSTFDRERLDALIEAIGLPFVGESDYENVDLALPHNLAVDQQYTFASIVLQN